MNKDWTKYSAFLKPLDPSKFVGSPCTGREYFELLEFFFQALFICVIAAQSINLWTWLKHSVITAVYGSSWKECIAVVVKEISSIVLPYNNRIDDGEPRAGPIQFWKEIAL